MENGIEQKDFPIGWDKRKEFVDVEGNVYQFGQLRPELKGTKDVTIVIKSGEQIYPPVEPNGDETEPLVEETKHAEPVVKMEPVETKAEAKDDILEMLMRQNMDLMERLRTLETALMSGRNASPSQVIVKEEKPKFGEMNTKDVTPDDFMEKKTKFFMFGRGYSMSSYVTREGRLIVSPYNVPLYFKKSFDDVRHVDGTNKVIPFCCYETSSQKECEFISNHPLYGVLIFSRVENAISSTMNDNVIKLESIVTRIHAMDKMQLFTLAQQHNIDLHLDVSEIKNKLVWLEIQREMETEKTQQALRMSDVEREKQMYKES